MFERFIKKNKAPEVANHAIVHDEELHDLDENAAGEKYHVHNMKPIDNSSDDPGKPKLHHVNVKHREGYEDALPPIVEEDAAEKWLKENDPDYYKRKNN